MDKLLAHCEKENKDNHGTHCLEQQKYFYPFVLSVDGMLGKEALVILSNLIQLVAEKPEEPISHVCSWVNGRIAIAVVRSCSRMTRRARIPSLLRDRDLDWDSGSGLGLAQ